MRLDIVNLRSQWDIQMEMSQQQSDIRVEAGDKFKLNINFSEMLAYRQ